MNIVLAGLLFILKLVGILVLAVLIIVLLVSLLPIGVKLEFKSETLTLDAVIGPIRRRILTRASEEKSSTAQVTEAEKEQAQESTKEALGTNKSRAQTKEQPESKAEYTEKPSGAKTEPTQPKAVTAQTKENAENEVSPAAQQEETEKSEEKEDAEQEDEGESSGFGDRLLRAIKRDPVTFFGHVFSHIGFLCGSLLRGIRVTELCVWLPVHAEEASQTALLFGSLMTALNCALTRLKEFMTIKAEELWLEPDFTGKQQDKLHIAFVATIRLNFLVVLLIKLVWRVWRDPVFAGVLPFTKAQEAS